MIKIFVSFIFIFLIPCQLAMGVLKSNLANSINAVPGEVVEMKITLGNDQDEPEKCTLKLCDYTFNAQGENFFPDPGTLPRSSGKWIELREDQVTIPPHKDLEVFYQIRVPNDASLKGSYWSVIMVEPEKVIKGKPPAAPNQMGINVKIRYAYQIITNIGHGTAKLKIIEKKVEADRKELYIDVINNGEIYLNPKLILKLFDKKGSEVKKYEIVEQKIYPDTSIRYAFDLKELESNKYTAVILLDNHDDNLFGDRFELTIP